jgi:D-alanyl-D-alanine dipeptidase
MKLFFCTLISVGIANLYSAVSRADAFNVFGPKEEQALLLAESVFLVVSDGWDEIQGVGQVFEKRNGQFVKEGGSFPIVLGRAGMAWGIGVSDYRPALGPKKVEGDGRSPAGFFELNKSFGLEEIGKLPFLKITDQYVCVDDFSSAFYNRIVNETEVVKDWKSYERMNIPLYSLGVEVKHNFSRPEPKGGSCIFLHLWRGPSSATAGCTAMSSDSMKSVLSRLGPASLLIQLPKVEYDRLRLPF